MKYKIEEDTIAAISTALSPSGIGIIRVSGPDAICIVDKIFRFAQGSSNDKDGAKKSEKNMKTSFDCGDEKGQLSGCDSEKNIISGCNDKRSRKLKKLVDVKSHTIHYGTIVQGQIAYDEVLVSVMRAPNTYTREDVVEINCHGGPFVCRKVLNLVLGAGARCAEPGEFTKRAFLNGRLKLTEAEAVMDVISAENDYALQNGVAQLSGSVQKEIRSLREEILGEIAYIEASLDDPEHMSLDGYAEELSVKTENILQKMEKLIRQADNGRIMKEGVRTAIVGRPNVGKSSLLNALLGENRAIVTDIAGTTRDTLEENIYFRGITLHLIDTAGIRKTEDTVEKIGVERAVEAVRQADLVLFVVDGSEKLTQEDMEIWELVREKKTILVRNKSDLADSSCDFEDERSSFVPKIPSDDKADGKDLSDISFDSNLCSADRQICGKEYSVDKHCEDTVNKRMDENRSEYMPFDHYEQKIMEVCRRKKIPVIEISAKTLEGMDALENQVEKMFYLEEIRPNTQVYITNARQKEALLNARDSMKLVKQSIEDGMPEDFFSIDLTDAYESLGKMIGETLEDDVAEQIFSKFCMGK